MDFTQEQRDEIEKIRRKIADALNRSGWAPSFGVDPEDLQTDPAGIVVVDAEGLELVVRFRSDETKASTAVDAQALADILNAAVELVYMRPSLVP